MKIIRQIGIIGCVLLISELLHSLFSLPIPTNVLGMALLFVLLCTGVVKESDIADVADFFYRNMSFFLIPVTCGIIVEAGALQNSALAFVLAALLSTVVVYLVTGQSVQLFQRLDRRIRGRRREG